MMTASSSHGWRAKAIALRLSRPDLIVMTLSGEPAQMTSKGATETSSPLRSEKLDLRLPSAAETLADRQTFQLDGERWEASVAAVGTPPQVHPRLARLLQEPSVLEQPLPVMPGEPLPDRTVPGQPCRGGL